MDYKIKDYKLAAQGLMNIEWAEQHMKILLKLRERFKKQKPLKGIRIGLALHITKETAALIRTLIAGGAKVAIASCNPLSTQDDIAAALAKEHVRVYGWKGESTKEYYDCIEKVIAFKPQITIDDGCDLVSTIHQKHPELIPSIICGTEETTTGVIRLRAMEKAGALKYPVIAVNDLNTKHLFDNYYGTGQSTIEGITRATNILIAGKTFVVAGYGPCGKGVALRAKGLGADVIITEVAHFPALQAKLDGFRVMTMNEAAKIGDIFVTVTGCKDVVTAKQMKLMKDSAILANSGHFDNEINVDNLKKISKKCRRIRWQLDEYSVGKKKLYLVAEGRLCNLAAAEGHPSIVMAQSFCGQALAVEWAVKNKPDVKIHKLPEEIDELIAKLQLEALGIKIDHLTKEQYKYLHSWKEGT